jgi:SAM-dependent methyltransferase
MQVFDETADAFAQAADRHIRERRYRRGELFLAAAVSNITARGYILDYGCGPGRISRVLADGGFRVLGLDPSQAMIAAATQQPLDALDVEFRVFPSCPGDIPEGPFDGIVCSSVIEYDPEPAKLLSWFSASLRASGVLIISFANSRSLWGCWSRLVRGSVFHDAALHNWPWPKFRRLLEHGGFSGVGRPLYFESPLDRSPRLGFLGSSRLVGTLGLVVARKNQAHPIAP